MKRHVKKVVKILREEAKKTKNPTLKKDILAKAAREEKFQPEHRVGRWQYLFTVGDFTLSMIQRAKGLEPISEGCYYEVMQISGPPIIHAPVRFIFKEQALKFIREGFFRPGNLLKARIKFFFELGRLKRRKHDKPKRS